MLRVFELYFTVAAVHQGVQNHLKTEYFSSSCAWISHDNVASFFLLMELLVIIFSRALQLVLHGFVTSVNDDSK